MAALTQKEVRIAVQLWRGDAEYAQRQIEQLRAICSHTDVGRRPYTAEEYGCATQYKYDCKCLDCGKVWVEDQ
jgi:hypothetical protein